MKLFAKTRVVGIAAGVVLGGMLATMPLAVSLAQAAVAEGVYFPESATLPNGMQVVVINKPGAAAVVQMVWYKVGSADEGPGESGVAHFLEHLMFKGTAKVGPGEFSRRVSLNGGRDNAFTSFDYTAYYQTVARDRLEMVMEMEADRMTGLKLTDELVKPEQQVVWEERRQRYENTPDGRLGEQVRAATYAHHPYGQPPIGWPQDIKALNRATAENFYRKWYTPNNAILVVAGDVTLAQVMPLAEKYYGVISARPVPARYRVPEPVLSAARTVTLRDAEVRTPEVEKLWHAPAYGNDPGGHAYALQVLAEIMGGGDTARMTKALVREGKLANSVYFAYSPAALDDTLLAAGGDPANGASPAALEKAIDGQIALLLKDGVTAEELATAKQRMLTRAAYALDGLERPANALGAAVATGRTLAEVEAWPKRIDAVTAEQVLAAAHAVFDRTDTTTGLLLPAGSTADTPADAASNKISRPLTGDVTTINRGVK